MNNNKLAQFHEEHQRRATVTAIQPAAHFGALKFNGDHVSKSVEKPNGDGGWINGGYFILEPDVFNYLSDDQDIWEQEPLRRLADEGELVAYRHTGFWAAMDTLRDKNHLEELWATKHAPWKVYGTGMELQAIAASVIGGASLNGGRGHVLGTLLGALIITIVKNAMNLNGIGSSLQAVIIGAIILIAVGIDRWRAELGRAFAALVPATLRTRTRAPAATIPLK